MSEHTKGPWRPAKPYNSRNRPTAVVADHSPTGGDTGTGHSDERAIEFYGGHLIAESIFRQDDVHLIANAPSLLAALEQMVRAEESGSAADLAGAILVAKVIIAKARGRS